MLYHLNKTLRLCASGVVATWLGGALQTAAAAPNDNDAATVVRQVSTAGLDLTKRADQAILHHRVAVAAYQVCGELTNGAGPASTSECFQRMLAETSRQADARIAEAERHAMVAAGDPRP